MPEREIYLLSSLSSAAMARNDCGERDVFAKATAMVSGLSARGERRYISRSGISPPVMRDDIPHILIWRDASRIPPYKNLADYINEKGGSAPPEGY